MQSIKEAGRRISHHAVKTPVICNLLANEISGRELYFKAENLQLTGSFKIRGALNSVLAMKERGQKVEGYVTHSTGNHGLALATASKLTDRRCTIVVPHDAPKTKIADIRATGAQLVFCEPNPTSRVETCASIQKRDSFHHIPSYDYQDVIAGQGTIALELLEQVPDLDAILVAVSGGGLISGISVAAKTVKPNIKIFAVEPRGKELEKSMRAGRRLWPDPPQFLNTIADAIRTQPVGHLTWPIIQQNVEKKVLSITDEEMVEGMKFSMTKLKMVVEAAAGAVVIAALTKVKDLDNSIQKIGVIVCGGNVDIDSLPWFQS